MPRANLDRLQSIKTLAQLAAYLRDELDWPIEAGDAEDITFDYEPAELGIDEKAAVRIKEIKQLRPLHGSQPWGIFFVNFEKKRLPVVVMRLILRALVFKKRASANSAERQAWQPHDLLFISAYGEDTDRSITFAHFVENPGSHLVELRVLGWDDDDTPLHMDYVAGMLHEKLRWDDKLAADPDAWRRQWSDAFVLRHLHVIRTSQELASALADLARRINSRVRTVLRSEDGFGQMRKLLNAFRVGLIHDLNDDGFADMFAQTVTYGLFSLACRRTVHGEGTAFAKDDLTTYFTSPFLKEMLGIFLGLKSRKGKIDFDELGVSDVTDLLTSPDTHMEAIQADFNNKTQTEDPVLYFYEHFLTAYNKKLKVERGVFYTPQPVVSYIVRGVHELLQTEFGLEEGLASTITWSEMVYRNPGIRLPPLTDEPDEKRTIDPSEPFVQILDVATGTATFIVEVIDVIHKAMVAKWKNAGMTAAQIQKAWNEYVPRHLLPRVYGFELMMAPYAIAHMKVGLKLSETGYLFSTEIPVRIYLTNTLEPKVKQLPQIGFDALAHEAAAVNEIKWYKRFTVVIGNPPYSNFGQLNKNPFILGLLENYKRGLVEKKLNLDDDFIKFIRFSQAIIEKATVGVLGFITNNVYLDGLTHRRMRESLLETFPYACLFDLHGSAKKLETSREYRREENVFDIQQGVSIGLFVRTPSSTKSAIAHADLWGTRESKYRVLNTENVETTGWTVLNPTSPNFFFVPKDFTGGEEYNAFPSLTETFTVFQNGLKTDRDDLFFDFNRDELEERIRKFYGKKYEAAFVERFAIHASSSYDIEARRDRTRFAPTKIRQCLYRPFDFRWLYYDPELTSRPASKVMRHQLAGKNLALVCLRQTRRNEEGTFLVSQNLINKDAVSLFDIGTVFPLFLYDETLAFDPSSQDAGFARGQSKRSNFAPGFLKSLAIKLQRPRKGVEGMPDGITPEDIFHYAYAVIYSPGYRSRYAEFLKIDFPRLPLTGNLEVFRALAGFGGDLVALHLMESPKLNKPNSEFIGEGQNDIAKGYPDFVDETVWINENQGFQGVPENVWKFHIGGYQVCAKWLKDRKGRTLSKDDIKHYHKILIALAETIRLMAAIDDVIKLHGGWPRAFTAEVVDGAEAPLPVLAMMTYPANETDKLVCALTLALVPPNGVVGSMDHLDAVLLVANTDWCRSLLPTAHQEGYDTAIARAPRPLTHLKGKQLRWKRCRDYLEKREAIEVKRPGASEAISRASKFGIVRKDFPDGVEKIVKYAMQGLAMVQRIRAGDLKSTTKAQQNLVQTLLQRSQETELHA